MDYKVLSIALKTLQREMDEQFDELTREDEEENEDE